MNWVRTREDAHVHLILTYATAASGTEYQFDFIGLGDFQGQDDDLSWTSSAVNTRDEIINGITRTMALGFVGYAQQLGLAEQLRVEFDAADNVQQARQAQNIQDPEEDPWDFWVFRLNGRVDLSGQDRRKTRNLNGTVTANRVTDDLKLQFNVTGRSNHTENQLSSGTWFDSDSKSWSATGVAVKSITDHWSLGSQFGSGSSSSANRRIGYRAAPALEWNLFPYSESTRRQLIFLYQVGVAWIDWWEETIYEETEEWVYDHRLRGDLNFRQPWGSGGTAVQVESLLDDISKWALTLAGNREYQCLPGSVPDCRGQLQHYPKSDRNSPAESHRRGDPDGSPTAGYGKLLSAERRVHIQLRVRFQQRREYPVPDGREGSTLLTLDLPAALA